MLTPPSLECACLHICRQKQIAVCACRPERTAFNACLGCAKYHYQKRGFKLEVCPVPEASRAYQVMFKLLLCLEVHFVVTPSRSAHQSQIAQVLGGSIVVPQVSCQQ